MAERGVVDALAVAAQELVKHLMAADCTDKVA